MMELKIIEQKGTEAVKKLRLHKLSNGHPFMINSKELMTNQCYLEYPNGSIMLASITQGARDFNIIRELTPLEAKAIRTRYKFSI